MEHSLFCLYLHPRLWQPVLGPGIFTNFNSSQWFDSSISTHISFSCKNFKSSCIFPGISGPQITFFCLPSIFASKCLICFLIFLSSTYLFLACKVSVLIAHHYIMFSLYFLLQSSNSVISCLLISGE